MSAMRQLRRFFRKSKEALPQAGMKTMLEAVSTPLQIADCRDHPKSAIPGVLKRLLVPWALLAAAAAAAFAEDMEAGKKQAPFRYDPGNHRDPFTPLVRDGKPVGSIKPGGAIDASKPVLLGILWDPSGHSMALINDTEVKVGDTVGGYKVAEIRQDAVVLTGGGEPVVLQISFDTPPKPSTGTKEEGGKP